MIALGFSLATAPSLADVLVMPEGASTPAMALPSKGSTMAVVEKNHGTPRTKRPTVGGDTPKHPPITRWDYDAFYVVFEHDKVVDAVVPGAPPKIYNKDELRPAVAGTAPPMQQSPAAPLEPAADVTEAPRETAPEAPAEAGDFQPYDAATEAPAMAAPGTYPDAPASSPPPADLPDDAPPTPK